MLERNETEDVLSGLYFKRAWFGAAFLVRDFIIIPVRIAFLEPMLVLKEKYIFMFNSMLI